MPLYEYQCESCGKKEERLEKFETPTKHDCLFCNATLGMHRQLSSTSFMLAGGGWMAQGYECSKGNKKEISTAPIVSSSSASACASNTVKQIAKPDTSSK